MQMLAGSLFNVASGLGDDLESDPTVFQASPQGFENLLLNFKEQDQLPGYSSAFGDTSALFGGIPAAQGWSFNPMSQDQAPGGLDFSSVFQAAPKDFGNSFSGGFNPSKITFDPSSVNRMSLEDNLNDYIAQGGGKPKSLFNPVNDSSTGIQSRQEQRVNAARQGPGGLRMPTSVPTPPRPEVQEAPKPRPGSLQDYIQRAENEKNKRFLRMMQYAEGTNPERLKGGNPIALRAGYTYVNPAELTREFPVSSRKTNTASGPHQFKPRTWDEQKALFDKVAGGDSGLDYRNPKHHDAMALAYAERRARARGVNMDQIDMQNPSQFRSLLNSLASSWASFPRSDGTGYYPGQRPKSFAELHREYLRNFATVGPR